eukprot:8905655-Alexandrium_andersonii.AAC.1
MTTVEPTAGWRPLPPRSAPPRHLPPSLSASFRACSRGGARLALSPWPRSESGLSVPPCALPSLGSSRGWGRGQADGESRPLV